MTKIFCNCVESEVDESLLLKGCHPTDGRCTLCMRSQQLDYGVKPEEILKRAKEERSKMSRLVCFIDDEGQVGTCLKEVANCDNCEYNDDDHKKFIESCCRGDTK